MVNEIIESEGTLEAAGITGYDGIKMCTDNLWKLLLRKDPDTGRTLMGLLEATAVKLESKRHYCASLPETFPCITDMLHDGLSKFGERKVLENFDPEKAGGWKNLPGYLAARWTGIVQNAAQDALRNKSIHASEIQDESFREMQAKRIAHGKKPLYYAVASRLPLEASRKDDCTAHAEPVTRGSHPSEWSGRCEWDTANPQETDAQAAHTFRENILWHLTPGEAAIAVLLEEHSIPATAEKLGTTTTVVRHYQASARKRLEKAGIVAKLAMQGHIV